MVSNRKLDSDEGTLLRAAFGRIAAGILACGLFVSCGDSSSPQESLARDQEALNHAATQLMAKEVNGSVLEVLRRHLDTEKYGIPTGYATPEASPPIEYRFREDESVWAIETGDSNNQRRWIDCGPDRICVSGIGAESLNEHLCQRDIAELLGRFDRITEQHPECNRLR